MRDTKTKGHMQDFSGYCCFIRRSGHHLTSSFPFLSGIWVWGTPVEMDINGVKTSVFYLDTEGFESIGKSNVYDDR